MPEERTTSSTGGQKGTKLARFDLIPAGALTTLAEHFGKGARKYAPHQWRNGYEWSKSYSALMRHLTQFWLGEDFDVCSNDPEGCSFTTAEGDDFVPTEADTCYNHTGSHHMVAVAWHSFVLLEFVDRFPEHDDRYIPEPEFSKFDPGQMMMSTEELMAHFFGGVNPNAVAPVIHLHSVQKIDPNQENQNP